MKGNNYTKVFWEYVRAFNAKNRYIISVGGTRSSKTYSAIQLLTIKAFNTPNIVIGMGGITGSVVRKNLMLPFKSILASSYNPKRFNKQENSYTFDNGAVVYFISADDPDKFEGVAMDYWLFDEANLFRYGEAIIEKTGTRMVKGMILTFNPSKKRPFIDDLEKRGDVVSLHSTWRDNDYLPRQIIDEILTRSGQDERYNKVYNLGVYAVDIKGSILTDWGVVNTFPDNWVWESWGQDYGFVNDATTLIQTVWYNDQLWIRSHLYEINLTTAQIAKANEVAGGSLIIGDSSEPRLINELSASGCNIIGIRKYPGHKLEGIRKLQGVHINVYHTSIELISEMEEYQWMKSGGEYIGKPLDKNDHLIDALIYAVRDKLVVNSGKYMFL